MLWTSTEVRDLFINAGAVEILISIRQIAINEPNIITKWCWSLCIICSYEPFTNNKLMKNVFAAICSAIASDLLKGDEDLERSLYTISHHLDQHP